MWQDECALRRPNVRYGALRGSFTTSTISAAPSPVQSLRLRWLVRRLLRSELCLCLLQSRLLAPVQAHHLPLLLMLQSRLQWPLPALASQLP